jgi:hypothetical protein
MASISASSIGDRRNRAGSSFLSKYSPFAGATGPRECPDKEPRLPSLLFVRPRGPCCCACCLYEENEEEEDFGAVFQSAGSSWEGAAGWAWGEWSTEAIPLSAMSFER